MSKLFCLNFMEPLNAVLSGGRSVIVTWLSERNRVEALAVGAHVLTRDVLSSLLGERSRRVTIPIS